MPEVCAAAGIAPGDVTAVGVAGCVPCLLLLDAARRAAAAGAALQRRPRRAGDRRAARRAGRRGGAGAHRRRCDAAVDRPEAALAAAARARTGRGDAAHLRLLRLARRAPRRSPATASATGRSRAACTTSPQAAFADDLLAAAGWDAARMSPIRDPGDVVGGVAAGRRRGHRACAPGSPVVAGLADHVASAFGAGLKAHGEVLREARRIGRHAVRDRPAAGRRAPLPRRASAPGPVAPERLHGHRRLRDPLVPARVRGRRAAGRSSTPRRRACRPAPTGWCSCRTCSARRRRSTIRSPRARSSGSASATRARTCSGRCSRASGTASATTSRCWPSTASRPTRARVTNGGASSWLWKQVVADITGPRAGAGRRPSGLGARVGVRGRHRRRRVRRLGRDRPVRDQVGEPVVPDPATRAVHDARHASTAACTSRSGRRSWRCAACASSVPGQ